MFCFNFNKMMQCVGVLIRQPGEDSDNYYKLLKLLYLAEKESLIETNHPITGDRLVAMPRGPVLGDTCDIFRGNDSRPGWREHFDRPSKYTLRMVCDPGDDLLCKYEVQKLEEVARRHKNDDWQRMMKLMDKLPEQLKNDPGKSSKDIPIEDVIGDSEGRIKALSEVSDIEVSLGRVFGR